MLIDVHIQSTEGTFQKPCWAEVRRSEQTFSFFLHCLIHSSPMHRQADLACKISRPAPLTRHYAGHAVSSLDHVCFRFTLRLTEMCCPGFGLSTSVPSFSMEEICNFSLRRDMMWMMTIFVKTLFFLVLFCLKLHESDRTRFVHA